MPYRLLVSSPPIRTTRPGTFRRGPWTGHQVLAAFPTGQPHHWHNDSHPIKAGSKPFCQTFTLLDLELVEALFLPSHATACPAEENQPHSMQLSASDLDDWSAMGNF